MKRVQFLDGPLNGTVRYLHDECQTWTVKSIESVLPPTFKDIVYAELVPGWWHVFKQEIKQFGI